MTRAPGGRSPINANDSIVLPLPDSPTSPSDSPPAMCSDTSLTVRSVSLPSQRRRRRRLVIPRGSLADGEAPWAALEHLDAGAHWTRHLATLLLAFAAHAALGGAAAFQHDTGAHPAPPAPRPPIEATLQRAAPPP